MSPTRGVNTIHLAPEIHEHFMIQKGYGTLCTTSSTLSPILRPLFVTNCMSGMQPRTTEHNARRVYMSHLTCSHWVKGLVSVISPDPIHACARGCLTVLFLLSKSFFHLFLIPAMVPDENSMEDPLCNSAIGSMVSLDYVTPDTICKPKPWLNGETWEIVWRRSC